MRQLELTTMRFLYYSLPLLLAILTSTSVAATDASKEKESYLNRAELKQFIDAMVSKHQFDATELKSLFQQVQPRPEIIAAISSPAEGKPWYQYRKIFLTKERIDGGVKFWNQHQATLASAEEKYGVPAQIMVAIIGVETRYGRFKGRHNVMDALATLAFDYPKRSKFFLSELEQYLLLTREESIDPLSLKGSYAGAMGGPQFISSSYRRYAVDFDNDGKRDLWENYADMIGSVANYFREHGWEKGHPVVSRAKITGDKYAELVKLGMKPKRTLGQISEYGVTPSMQLDDNEKAALLEFETKNGHEYWLGLNNFYVITRYNHSPLYAMAVFQLSNEIASRKRNGQ